MICSCCCCCHAIFIPIITMVTSNGECFSAFVQIEFSDFALWPIHSTPTLAILINRNVIVFICENITGFVGLFHSNWRHNQYSSRRNAYRIQFTNCRTYTHSHIHIHIRWPTLVNQFAHCHVYSVHATHVHIESEKLCSVRIDTFENVWLRSFASLGCYNNLHVTLGSLFIFLLYIRTCVIRKIDDKIGLDFRYCLVCAWWNVCYVAQ